MKRIIVLALTALLTLSLLCSCSILDELIGELDGFVDPGISDGGLDDDPIDPDEDERNDDTEDNGNVGDTEAPDNTDKPDEEGKEEGATPESKYKYTDFTTDDKALLTRYLGYVIPFAPCNEYYIEGYYDVDDYENGINYYTIGNTAEDFAEYRKSFSSYTFVESYEDIYGDTCYIYEKGDLEVDISFYYDEGNYFIDVYAYSDKSSDGLPSLPGGDEDDGGYIYTEFSEADKALFARYIGAEIPFAPCDEYYIEGYYDVDDYENGLNYYTVGNTEADFTAYLALFSGYSLTDTYQDDYGDTWYTYEKGDVVVDISFYSFEGDTYIDVFVYSSLSEDGGDEGGTGGSDSSESSGKVIANNGKGLPEGNNGVYDVDFKKAENVKDVTDQGYYLDGCPTVGSPAVLVIPVQFTDATAASKGYSIDKIVRAFSGGVGQTDYYSVHDYYYISSYGKLDLDITVVDNWFCPKYTSSYYYSQTMDYLGDEMQIGDQIVLDEALAYLSTFMDLSSFDSDGNGIIDAVVMINTLKVDDSKDFNWAYRYWNVYTDANDEYYEYDGVSANDYIWASYGFIHESYDLLGNSTYTDTSVLNTYTYIHEFGHILGADDYYDTSGEEGPLEGCDVMDTMAGDHSAFTKFNFGWITTSRLIVTDSSVTVSLKDFGTTGDTIIIANDWDEALGAYQEYFVIVYYKNDGLNADDNGYFVRDGIVVYHVNASLTYEEYDGELFYDIAYNNTDASDPYGTVNDLVSFLRSAEGNITYVAGDAPGAAKLDNGQTLEYTFTVNSISDSEAVLTFTKLN